MYDCTIDSLSLSHMIDSYRPPQYHIATSHIESLKGTKITYNELDYPNNSSDKVSSNKSSYFLEQD